MTPNGRGCICMNGWSEETDRKAARIDVRAAFLSVLYVETEEHDVAVLDDIVFSF